MTVLERAEQLKRRKEIYEELYPETKQGVAGGKASGQARRTTADSAVVHTPSFMVELLAVFCLVLLAANAIQDAKKRK